MVESLSAFGIWPVIKMSSIIVNKTWFVQSEQWCPSNESCNFLQACIATRKLKIIAIGVWIAGVLWGGVLITVENVLLNSFVRTARSHPQNSLFIVSSIACLLGFTISSFTDDYIFRAPMAVCILIQVIFFSCWPDFSCFLNIYQSAVLFFQGAISWKFLTFIQLCTFSQPNFDISWSIQSF